MRVKVSYTTASGKEVAIHDGVEDYRIDGDYLFLFNCFAGPWEDIFIAMYAAGSWQSVERAKDEGAEVSANPGDDE